MSNVTQVGQEFRSLTTTPRPDRTGACEARVRGQTANQKGHGRARVLRVHRSSNGSEAGSSEWERDTGDLNEWTEILTIWASGVGPSPSVYANLFWTANGMEQKGLPGSQIWTGFSLSPKAKSGEWSELIDGALSQRWDGGRGLQEILTLCRTCSLKLAPHW